MTVTETPPEAEAAAPAETSTSSAAPEPGGLAAVVGTGDHKILGRLFIAFSLTFGLLAELLGTVVAVDRIDGTLGDTILSVDTAYQAVTLQITAEAFLLLMPLIIGIAFVVVPLQVGSRTIAFPRAAAASFWGWLIGSGVLLASYGINGGPGGGSADGVSLWAISLGMVVASLLLASVCIAVTVLGLRAPGMSLDRTPLFSWAMFCAASLWILSLPVLLATLALIYVDHRYGQVFLGLNGPDMWNHVSWVFRQPQVYALAVPVLGIVGEAVAVASRTRQPQRHVMMTAIGAFSVLGFGAFMQPSIVPGSTDQPLYVGMALLIVLPVVALTGGWVAAIRDGSPRLTTPLLFAVSSLLLLLASVLIGAMRSVDSLELANTVFDDAHRNVTVLAALVASVGALWHWGSKITGGTLPDALGKLTALVLLVGSLAVAVPDALSGAFGEGKELGTGIEALNAVVVAGRGLVLMGLVLVVLALVAAVQGASADADPWGGQTLEWSTDSPPSAENFAEIPTVASAEPLLDRATADKEDAA